MMWFDAGWVKSCRESKACDPTHKPAFISQEAAPPLLCSSCPKRDADTDYVTTHPHSEDAADTRTPGGRGGSKWKLHSVRKCGLSADQTEGRPLALLDFIVWTKPWIHSHAASERCRKHRPGHRDSPFSDGIWPDTANTSYCPPTHWLTCQVVITTRYLNLVSFQSKSSRYALLLQMHTAEAVYWSSSGIKSGHEWDQMKINNWKMPIYLP